MSQTSPISLIRWYLGWPLAIWHRWFPGRWTQEEIDEIHERAHAKWLRMQRYIDYPDAEIDEIDEIDSPCASGCKPSDGHVCGGPRCT